MTTFEVAKAEAQRKGLKIQEVGQEILKGYDGMNPLAAKTFGMPLEKNAILVDKNLSGQRKVETICHELIELDLMQKGLSYWQAHSIALKNQGKCKIAR